MKAENVLRFPASPETYCNIMKAHNLKVRKRSDKKPYTIYEADIRQEDNLSFFSWLFIAPDKASAENFFVLCIEQNHMGDGDTGVDGNLTSVCKVCEDKVLKVVSVLNNTVLITSCIPATEELMWSIIHELGYLPGWLPNHSVPALEEAQQEPKSEELPCNGNISKMPISVSQYKVLAKKMSAKLYQKITKDYTSYIFHTSEFGCNLQVFATAEKTLEIFKDHMNSLRFEYTNGRKWIVGEGYMALQYENADGTIYCSSIIHNTCVTVWGSAEHIRKGLLLLKQIGYLS